ncbi:MAG: nucleotidyltransferase domain-containing protein [Chloroflexota bacterium]|nr:nucleotidyltransferase domain-containing protein [Chloroflexota bacterium]
MIPAAIADHVILRSTVGSTVHGLHLASQDDRDEMGVYIEPPEYVIGLNRLDHYVERTQPEGVRSGPGDLDLVLYSLRKWMRLALKGNPTALLLLFAPPLEKTEWGEKLVNLTPAIVSQQAARPFVGYLNAQKHRLLGLTGGKHTNRPELVAAHGFDTKYAMHAVRLGLQGIELLTTGRITLPMPEPDRSKVLALRRGEMSFGEAVAYLDAVELRLGEVANGETRRLREYPDYSAVGQFLLDAYRGQWGW